MPLMPLMNLRPANASRRASAYHEAAHAVVGVRLGLKLREVRVRTKKSGRKISYGYASFLRGRIDPMRDGMMTMAGTAAEQRWFRMPKSRASQGDWKYLERYRGYEVDSILTLLDLSRAQVDLHAEGIERVAERLMTTGKMTGKEVKALLRSMDKKGRFPSHR